MIEGSDLDRPGGGGEGLGLGGGGVDKRRKRNEKDGENIGADGDSFHVGLVTILVCQKYTRPITSVNSGIAHYSVLYFNIAWYN
jgi:hypothetical protein